MAKSKPADGQKEANPPFDFDVGHDAQSLSVEERVKHLAREKLAEADGVLRQIDSEWSPPFFDPFLIAQVLGIRCLPVDEPKLRDAMIFMDGERPTILYRRGRPAGRTHFALFHEIAHTLFPDYRKNHLYWQARRPRLFEPEGQLERLCDLAAIEFLLPMDYFRADLLGDSFSAAKVDGLCQRYRAPAEKVCLRAVEADVAPMALALYEPQYQPKRRGRSERGVVRFSYLLPSDSFGALRLALPNRLHLSSYNCIERAARSKKIEVGEEVLGRGQRCRVEALPRPSGRSYKGRCAVLAFFYPA